MLRSKLVVAYFAVPPLALVANWVLVVRDELASPYSTRADTRITPPIPAADRCACWNGVEGRNVAPAGGRLRVVVNVTNCGRRVWPDRIWAAPPEAWGKNAVRFSARWNRVGGPPGEWLLWRGDLPHAVLPGKSLELPLYVPAPLEPGRYLLDIGLIQELVGWFGDGTTGLLRLPLDVL